MDLFRVIARYSVNLLTDGLTVPICRSDLVREGVPNPDRMKRLLILDQDRAHMVLECRSKTSHLDQSDHVSSIAMLA